MRYLLAAFILLSAPVFTYTFLLGVNAMLEWGGYPLMLLSVASCFVIVWGGANWIDTLQAQLKRQQEGEPD